MSCWRDECSWQVVLIFFLDISITQRFSKCLLRSMIENHSSKTHGNDEGL